VDYFGHDTYPAGGICDSDRELRLEYFAELAHVLRQPAGTLRSTVQDGQVESVYPQSYWPGDGTGDHLEFALKYDGVNLGILSALFEVVPADELATWISSKPTGKYARRIWFLYEFLTGQKLPLPDLTKGNYTPLLEADRYYAVTPGRRMQRQRIIDNLLGGKDFCPVIRRTENSLPWRESP